MPLVSDDSTASPICDAEIILIKDDFVYTLVPSGDSGYYHYAGTGLEVNYGDQFRIEVTYNGRTATGETIIPDPPEEVSISVDTIEIPFIFRQGTLQQIAEIDLHVSWTNPENLLHFSVVENLEDSLVNIFPDRIGQITKRFRLISLPSLDSIFQINTLTLEYFGRHEVTVYRINREYAELYLNRVQDSRDLNEPPSNIYNGLGVFTAFSGKSVYFDVIRKKFVKP